MISNELLNIYDLNHWPNMLKTKHGVYLLSFFSETTLRLNAELLVHSEVNANELGFSGLSPKILFYK